MSPGRRHLRTVEDVRLPTRDAPGRFVLDIPDHVERVRSANGRRWVRNPDPDTRSMGDWCGVDERGRLGGDLWHTDSLLDTHAPLVEW